MPRLMLLLGLAAAVAGCRLNSETMEDRTPRGCAECHTETARQWASSAHARAWHNPKFVAETQGHARQPCLGCHAPQPLLEQSSSGPPPLRDKDRQCGVDCHACHAVACAYAGPYSSRIGPHKTVQDRTRLPCSSFCGTCHEVEHAEYTSLYIPAVEPGQARHCADCHMPPSVSRLTQGHLLSLIHPRRVVRDHSMPAFAEEVVKNSVVADRPVVRLLETTA
ncbi:MAG: hypothetical protein HUU20_23145, partial [Pirellulales bacterium]|nr:hypothetical protein [Pirellulales bacterium]